MASNPIYTTEMRVLSAETFLSGITRTTPDAEILYMFMGKTDAWADDNDPPQAVGSTEEERTTRSDIVAVKRVFGSDGSLMIPRYNWTSGTIYTEYDDADVDIFDKPFYVMNSSFNVYKCLGNNSDAQSTVEPTGTSTSPIVTGDGYTWKFMYDISASDASAFVLEDFIPVPTGDRRSALQLAVEASASDSVGEPFGGHGLSAHIELGAFYLVFVTTFDGDEGGVIPTNIAFRQVGIMLNIKEDVSGDLATSTVYDYTDIDSTSGRMLYVENREPINRAPAQSEKFPVVLTF